MPEKKDYAQDVQRLSDYLIREYTEETIKKDSKINRLNFLTKCVIEQKVNLENINEGIEKLKFDDRLKIESYKAFAYDILNMAVGYDYKGFSCRLSMLYQADVFKSPNFYWELRGRIEDYFRMDFSLKQKLPWAGLQVYCNINNINEATDKVINNGTNFPYSEEHYGRTIDVGLRWSAP